MGVWFLPPLGDTKPRKRNQEGLGQKVWTLSVNTARNYPFATFIGVLIFLGLIFFKQHGVFLWAIAALLLIWYFSKAESRKTRGVNRIPFKRGTPEYDRVIGISQGWSEATVRAGLVTTAFNPGSSRWDTAQELKMTREERTRRDMLDPHRNTEFSVLEWETSTPTKATAEVKLAPGLTYENWVKAVPILRDFYGIFDVRVSQTRPGYVGIAFLFQDPLEQSKEITQDYIRTGLTANDPLLLGYDESGQPLTWNLAQTAQHGMIVGQTRSGKSLFTYCLAAQAAIRPDVSMTVIDANGVLSQPFHGSMDPDKWLDSVTEQIKSVWDEMRRRMFEELPKATQDKLTDFSVDMPVLFVLIDEYAGFISLLRARDKSLKPAERKGPIIEGYIDDLFAQGAKVGIRTVIITQRPDADIIGGVKRDNIAFRVMLRMASPSGARMVYPELDPQLAEAAPSFAPGKFIMESLTTDQTLGRGVILPGGIDNQYQTFVKIVEAGKQL